MSLLSSFPNQYFFVNLVFLLPDQRGGFRRPGGPRACLCHPSRPYHAEGSEESGGETAEGFKKQHILNF